MLRISRIVVVAIGLLTVDGSLAETPFSEPRLERYQFDIGQSRGWRLSFRDSRLGNGTAFLGTEMASERGTMDLRLEIGRHVPPDTVTFALLVSGIRIRFLDRARRVLAERVLEGEDLGPGGLFVIGDSADGYFVHQETLRGLGRARRVVLEISGNYE